MRKLVAAILISAMLISCIGCNKKTKPASSSSEAPTTSAATTTAPQTTTVPSTTTADANAIADKKKADQIVQNFLNTLKNKDLKGLQKYMRVSDQSAYDKVLSNINFTNFNPIYINETAYEYKVSFSTECKGKNIFLNSNNEYTLNIHTPDNENSVYSFSNAKVNDDSEQIRSNLDNIRMCIFHEFVLSEFPTLTESDYSRKTENYENYFDQISGQCLALFTTSTGKYDKITPDEVNSYVVRTFGFNNIDIRRSRYFNKNSGYLEGWQHGGISFVSTVNSINKLSDGKTEIVIDYYADSIYFVKARTVKYILSGTPDKDLKIVSRSVVSNNNLTPVNTTGA